MSLYFASLKHNNPEGVVSEVSWCLPWPMLVSEMAVWLLAQFEVLEPGARVSVVVDESVPAQEAA